MVVAPRTADMMRPSKLDSLSKVPTKGLEANDDEARLETGVHVTGAKENLKVL